MVTGYFSDSTSFSDTTLSTPLSGNDDTFIAEYDQQGVFQSVNQIGGSSNVRAYDITTDSKDNFLITGVFTQTAEFGICLAESYACQRRDCQ